MILFLAHGVGMGVGGTPGQDGIDPYLPVPFGQAGGEAGERYEGGPSPPTRGEAAGPATGAAGKAARGQGWGRA